MNSTRGTRTLRLQRKKSGLDFSVKGGTEHGIPIVVLILVWCYITAAPCSSALATKREPVEAWVDDADVRNIEFALKCWLSGGGYSIVTDWNVKSHLRPGPSCSHRNIPIVFWLLLLSGGVEVNPDPVYKYPCTVCSRKNQRGIQCNRCDYGHMLYVGMLAEKNMSSCLVVSVSGFVHHA